MSEAYLAGQYVGPQQQVPRKLNIHGQVPARVAAAMNFVKMSNESMGQRYVTTDEGTEVYDAELHFAQEVAFRAACGAIEEYFNSGE